MKIKILLPLIMLFFVTGCYNYNELNTLAISTGMGIDYENDEYVVSILIANSKKAQVSSKEGEAQSVVYEGRGKTISECLKEIEKITPKQVYIGHLSVIIISEELAKKGLIDIVDFLIREPESIKRFYLVVVQKSKAKDVLEIVTPLESFPAQGLSINIGFSNETQTVASTVPYSDFVEELLRKGDNPALPTIKIIGDSEKEKTSDALSKTTPEAYIELSNLGLFKADKLIHITSEEESRGLNIIANQADEVLISLPCSGGRLSSKVSRVKTSIKTKIKNNKPEIDINVKATATVQEANCKINFEDNKVILDIENKVNDAIKELVQKAIAVNKQFNVDTIGIGNLVYKHHPKYFNEVEEKWDEEIFPNIDFNITTKINLRTKGSIESTMKGSQYEK